MKTSTQKIAKALRAGGRTVVTGTPKFTDRSNFWLIDGLVLNVQTFSLLGKGCYGQPGYEATRDALVAEAKSLLTQAGISFVLSLTPDQLFLNGYEPKSYTAAERLCWVKLNQVAVAS